jgi:regulation of enolase protein 1 (concanavalin A-like superfamily)
MFHLLIRLWLILASCLLPSTIRADDGPSARRVPGWGEVIDPARDCKVAHDAERDRLTIAVPGTPHLLSVEVPGQPMQGPRVVREVYGDFNAVVKVGGRLQPGTTKTTFYDPYHGAGLIARKDDRTYLRLERAVGFIGGRDRPYLNYELRLDGKLAASLGVPVEDRPVFLKLERKGDEVRAWYGPDGKKWSELPDIAASIAGRIEVGVDAINSARRPLLAELERFRLVESGASEPPPVPTPEPAPKSP